MLARTFESVNADLAMGLAAAPIHVLAVDDDPSTREMIADYLGDNDVQVTTLASGEAIAGAMERQTIDVQVGRLRRKIKAKGARTQLIHTERGAGYIFTALVETVR
jgi:DNA-binding response OmpR family regulator